MPTARLVIYDECNVRIENIDPKTRRKMVSALKFFIPQARYMPSYKLGRWDGTVSLCTSGGRTFLNMLDFNKDEKGIKQKSVMEILVDAGYEFEIDDQRKPINLEFAEIEIDYFKDTLWPTDHIAEGEPVILRDYQIEIINNFLKNPQCVQEVATGAGKTLITAALSAMAEEYGRTVVIVPNRDLVTQTEEDYKNLGLDVGVFYGGRNEWNKTHTICTWQSLDRLDKKSKDHLTEEEIGDFLEGVQCIMVDEVHGAKADVLKRLLTGPFANCPIRWGLTGTVPKEDFNFVNILASLGPVINKLAAKELQDMGVLARCNVNIRQTKEVTQYDNYQTELKFLLQDKRRASFLAEEISKIATTGNTLVLIQQVGAGEQLTEFLGEKATFVYGGTKSQDRQDEYKSVHHSDDKIIVATYGVAAVGINIPRIYNLVLIEPGKSFVRVIQSIGRGLRKAKDKDSVEVWDFTSTCKFSARHLTARKRFYKDAEYPYKVVKLDYL